MTNVAVIGDGQMGLVMADALVERGVNVRLWGPFPTHIDDLAERRKSARLPDFMLSDAVRVTPNVDEAFADVDVAINAIPTQFIRDVWGGLSKSVSAGVPIACVAKGIEIGTNLLPTQIIDEQLGGCNPTCVLSGPTIATELVRRQPAVMVSSSKDVEIAKQVQDLFDVPWLRIYTHGDPLGVELAGNAKSAMLARGLAEISRLGVALGAELETFFGIAGVGDLATTCFSPHGRNRTCGERLGKGEDLKTITETMGSVVEGVATTKAVYALAKNKGVDMPIASAMYSVLFEDLAMKDAISLLMSRDLRAEQLRR